MVNIQFDVYTVTSIHDDVLTLTWLEFIGRKRLNTLITGNANDVVIPTFNMQVPIRLLSVSGDLGDRMHTAWILKSKQVESMEGRGKSHLEHFNGKLVYYLDKNKLDERLETSRVFRRLVDADMIELITNSVSGIDYDSVRAYKKIGDIGRSMYHDGSSQISSSMMPKGLKLWASVQHLPAMMSVLTITRLYAGGWNGDDGYDYAHLSLQQFCHESLKAGLNTSNSRLNDSDAEFKRRIALALLSFELYLMFTCGNLYSNITVALRDFIITGPGAFIHWSSDYVRYEIESLIHRVFRLLSSTSQNAADMNGLGDITCATGVRQLFMTRLRGDNLLDTTRQMHFESTVKNVIEYSSTSRTPAASTLANTANNSALTRSASPLTAKSGVTFKVEKIKAHSTSGTNPTSNVLTSNPSSSSGTIAGSTSSIVTSTVAGRSENICYTHVLFELKAKDSQGNYTKKCVDQFCKFPHTPIGSLTKPQKIAMLKRTMRGNVLREALALVG
jgi:hypothetical protein